jgi:hypothetical protein
MDFMVVGNHSHSCCGSLTSHYIIFNVPFGLLVLLTWDLILLVVVSILYGGMHLQACTEHEYASYNPCLSHGVHEGGNHLPKGSSASLSSSHFIEELLTLLLPTEIANSISILKN